jgi:uncharacterized membrane protein YdbT with pleckstrin-like domain
MRMSADERLVFSSRFSKRIFLKPFIISCLIVAAVLALKAIDTAPEHSPYYTWTTLILIVLTWIGRVSSYFLSHFIVTNKRIIIRHGLLSRQTYEMLLQKVESVRVSQSLMDRLWGSGTLIVTGTGGSNEQFPNVGSAVEFQESLNELLHADN